MQEEGAGAAGTASRSEATPHAITIEVTPVEYYVIDVNVPSDRYHIGELSLWRKRGYPWKLYTNLAIDQWQAIVKKRKQELLKDRVDRKLAEKREAERKAAQKKRDEEEAAQKKRAEKAAQNGAAKKSAAQTTVKPAKAKPPVKTKEELEKEKKLAQEAQENERKSIQAEVMRSEGDALAQRATSIALQEVARDAKHQPQRAEIMKEIDGTLPPRDSSTQSLLSKRYCRALSVDKSHTPAADYKIPTWEVPGDKAAPSIYWSTNPGKPYGGAPVILMSLKGQELVYLSTSPKIRIHSGRGVDEPYPFRWEGNTANGYHVIQEGSSFNGLWWTEGCVRVSKGTREALVDLLKPLKDRAEKKQDRSFVGFVIVREDLPECAAKDLCSHKAVRVDPKKSGNKAIAPSGPVFEPNKRTAPTGKETGSH